MKIITDNVNGCEYLTAWEEYTVIHQHPAPKGSGYFDILCDTGSRITVGRKNCPHIGQDWTVIDPFGELSAIGQHVQPEDYVTEEEEEEWARMEADMELTGGHVDYYKAWVAKPTSDVKPYTLEVNDFIEAFDLTYAEANVVKAIARLAQLRKEQGKPGSFAQYEAEKQRFFSERIYIQNVE